MHPLDQMMNQQNLANQGLGQFGADQAASQYHALGGAGGGGDGGLGFIQRGLSGTRYVSTMEMMENDVADWLLDWDK